MRMTVLTTLAVVFVIALAVTGEARRGGGFKQFRRRPNDKLWSSRKKHTPTAPATESATVFHITESTDPETAAPVAATPETALPVLTTQESSAPELAVVEETAAPVATAPETAVPVLTTQESLAPELAVVEEEAVTESPATSANPYEEDISNQIYKEVIDDMFDAVQESF